MAAGGLHDDEADGVLAAMVGQAGDAVVGIGEVGPDGVVGARFGIEMRRGDVNSTKDGCRGWLSR
jgi:hypothetical protein